MSMVDWMVGGVLMWDFVRVVVGLCCRIGHGGGGGMFAALCLCEGGGPCGGLGALLP